MVKNKLIIFDLDGVLIDSKIMHFDALNHALVQVDKKYFIDYNDHLKNYDGLSTFKKLEILTKLKSLPKEAYDEIYKLKQNYTNRWIDNLKEDRRLIDLFQSLKNDNTIAVASNSIRNTVKNSLLNLGLMKYVDFYASNQDVSLPKPHPEIYWKCMTVLNFIPSNTLIVEDSPIGREGARNSGATLIEIDTPSELTLDLFKNYD